MKKTTKKTAKKPSRKMSAEAALGLINFLETVERYFKHPDIEAILGYQVAGASVMGIDEIAWYLKDHVIDPEGEGLTAKDRSLIAQKLRDAANLLSLPEVERIPFALSAKAISARLREAAATIKK